MIEYSNLHQGVAQIDNNTRKKKREKSRVDKKAELWKLYDNVIEDGAQTVIDIECIYSKDNINGSSSPTSENLCEQCEYPLALNEDCFLTCSNPQCCIIYKNNVDHSAEWRYYGADDTQFKRSN